MTQHWRHLVSRVTRPLYAPHVSTGIARVASNGIEIAYETFGEPGNLPLLLIMGLGTQLIAWPDELCADLAGRGMHVIRFDNRDTGLSTHLDGAASPSPAAVVLKRTEPPYQIDDMARDATGLLDALELPSAHVVGASMGGFIAQTMAIETPSRVRSLTLIMTSTGSRRVGYPRPSVVVKALRRRPQRTAEEAVDAVVETFKLIGSPGYPFDEHSLRDLARRSFERGQDASGYLRQLAAILAQPDRTSRLQRLDVATTVIHGLSDPLVGVTGGLALARAIKGARFVGFSGMGHDLPRPVLGQLADEIAGVVARGEERAGRR